MHTNMLSALPRTKTYFFPCAQRKAGRRKRARRYVALPLLFSFPWSHALRHQSLAFRDYLTFVWKTKHCPEEEAQDSCMKEKFLWKSLRKQDIQSIYNRCHIIEHFICKPDKRFTRMVNTVVVGGGEGGTVMRALAFHQCGPDSNPGVDAIGGLSLLLVLSFTSRRISPGTPVSPPPPPPTDLLKKQHLANSNSI